MDRDIVSAVFDSQAEAQRAIQELRAVGVEDRHISVIARDEHGRTRETRGDDEGDGDTAASVASKTAAGAGIGALLGVAALAIPGVGPLVGAGMIAEAAVGGAAITGTAAGAVAGGVAGLLTSHGVSDEDARYYEGRINEGGVFVAVEPDRSISRERAEEILYGAGGHNSRRARETTV